MIQIYFQLV